MEAWETKSQKIDARTIGCFEEFSIIDSDQDEY